jgi:hypothetical protein
VPRSRFEDQKSATHFTSEDMNRFSMFTLLVGRGIGNGVDGGAGSR